MTRTVHRLPRAFLAVIAAVIALLTTETAARMLEMPTPRHGWVHAQRWCSGCHSIDGTTAESATDAVPGFASIANRPGQTRERIESLLTRPHGSMPDLHLTHGEVLDLLAYFESLRIDPSILPLSPPMGEDDPRPAFGPT